MNKPAEALLLTVDTIFAVAVARERDKQERLKREVRGE